MSTTAVRRGSLTLTDCDRELHTVAGALAAAHEQHDDHRARELHAIADEWLDLRFELAEHEARIAREGVRGL